jgi:hypothetical protein
MSQPAKMPIVDGDFFAASGPLPPLPEDGRRFPRFHYRSRAEALIYPLSSDKPPSSATCEILTRDLSRSGLSLVHTAQLFPGQKLEVSLADGSSRRLEVVWCRRWNDGLYLVGCRFTK